MKLWEPPDWLFITAGLAIALLWTALVFYYVARFLDWLDK